MKTQSLPRHGKHAIVIGGSIAGLMTARVLSDFFERVTILERDPVADRPEARKGQPQTRHLHALLAGGMGIMSEFFPDLPNGLVAAGAKVDDMAVNVRWHIAGGYRKQFESGLIGSLSSRPMLEWQVRQRVLALSNMALIDRCSVEQPIVSEDRTRIIGVKATRRVEGAVTEVMLADLVVDASGRGAAAPKWLESLGYERPAEESIKVNLGYATRLYRRKPGDMAGLDAIFVSAEPPQGKRAGLIFFVEDDRWIVTLVGSHGDHPGDDEEAFMDFARSLESPDIYNAISRLEPISDIVLHKFPASLRRRYEKLTRFPEGYLVLGDAVSSFNPVYGQGMTSASMQAKALHTLLVERANLTGLWRPYFARIGKVLDIPWQLAAGADFAFEGTEGKKPPAADLINAYMKKVNQATHHDTVVYGAFLRVLNLLAPPTSLFHPRILWRVLTASRRAVQPAPALRPLPNAGD
jgi:2-polyprenyl-6-methoxyphenol hydroxylase-like FAD-dependent oxidoreductase